MGGESGAGVGGDCGGVVVKVVDGEVGKRAADQLVRSYLIGTKGAEITQFNFRSPADLGASFRRRCRDLGLDQAAVLCELMYQFVEATDESG